jgi:DNA modification methylase
MAETKVRPQGVAVPVPVRPAPTRPPARKPRNLLNDLSGKEWIKFTKTWFICDSRRYARNRDTELHPARYPEELVSEFVGFFTKAGQSVLDPFCGSAATLVSCHEMGRRGVGVELSARYYDISRKRLTELEALSGTDACHIVHGDANRLTDPALWAEYPGEKTEQALPQFDFVITSPPYFDMLRKSRGGVESAQKKRAKAGLDTHYSDDRRDLGNIAEYEDYLEAMGGIFDQCAGVLKPRGYMVVVVQNMRDVSGEVLPLAWDLQRRICRTFSFQGEKIWCQNSKPLGIWGYPSVFVPNYHHHYCLIFRNR